MSKHGVTNKLCLVGVNANGIQSKLNSLNHIISELNPSVICLQETKCKKVGRVKIESKGYIVFELLRKESGGGGLATLVKADLTPVWVAEGDDFVEILVVEIHIDSRSVRIINCYAPQECDAMERKVAFWARLHSEIFEAEEAGISVIVQFDSNMHAGSDIIKNDPNKQNTNGRLFAEFLSNNPSIILANNSEKCEGDVTRERIKDKKTERAILDLILISEDLETSLESMKIDSDRDYPLCSYLRGKPKNSDHFTLSALFDIKFRKQRPEREERYNFKSPEGFDIFKQILDNEDSLTRCFDNEDSIEKQVDKWYMEFNKILSRCFKRVRITDKVKPTRISELFKMRTEIKQREKKDKDNMDINVELEDIESEISAEIGKQNRDKIFQNFSSLDQSEGGALSQGLWDIKKKVFPKTAPAIPAAKRDITGRIITDPAGLKKLYLETFSHRLRTRPSKQSVVENFELQKALLEKRLVVTEEEDCNEWSEFDVTKVMKSLKNGKSRDPLGLINELFKVQGSDLIKSLALMMNRVRSTLTIPNLFSLKDISPIYKNKGSRLDLVNDRGIFLGTTLHNFLQKLVYLDIYDILDNNLSDSNVGARKKRNIRNHSLIVNSSIHEANKNKKSKGLDILIADYSQCFDGMSLPITLNDIYNTGITDRNLNLMHKSDNSINISVKTPFGKTERFTQKDTIPQGDVLSNLKCTTQVDSIAVEHEANLQGHIYKYKDEVEIPPLGQIDDQIIIVPCGLDSLLASSHLNAMTNLKTLQFGAKKCVYIHAGPKKIPCPKHNIDTWKLDSSVEKVTSILETFDIEADKHVMEEVQSWKYLGDVIRGDGSNNDNIKDRVERGIGTVNQIVQMLQDLCLGPWLFESFVVLRSALLLSTLVSNSESWVNLTKKNISDLESIDESLLRKVFSDLCSQTFKSTPKELLYLELGCIPIRFILKSRRLNFLWYLLNQKEDSLLHKFFEAQLRHPVKNDWASSVKEDLSELDIDMTFDQIRSMSQDAFKNAVKNQVKMKALDYLKNIQSSHTKSKKMFYNELRLQDYLGPEANLTNKEKAFAFASRAHMLDLKNNFKIGKKDFNCSLGCDQLEDQPHLLSCPIINSELEKDQANYDDIFGTDPKKIEKITKTLIDKYTKFKTTVHRSPEASAATATSDINDNNVNVNVTKAIELD